jgi:hypothetical protein
MNKLTTTDELEVAGVAEERESAWREMNESTAHD